jgi:hypothetical protein
MVWHLFYHTGNPPARFYTFLPTITIVRLEL